MYNNNIMKLTATKFYLMCLYCMSKGRKTKWEKEQNAFIIFDNNNIVKSQLKQSSSKDCVIISSLLHGREERRMLNPNYYYNKHDLRNFIKYKTGLVVEKPEEE